MRRAADLVVVAPLRIEAAAVRRGLPGGRLLRVGMRARHLDGVAAALRAPECGAVAVVGVGGGLAPHLRAGDVVVADKVRGPRDVIDLPTAPILAAALRRAGLPVYVGAIEQSERVLGRRELMAFTGCGALAVDLESARVLRAARGRPAAVVRVVSDTVTHPWWHPGIVPNGLLALRTLALLGPPLRRWAAAVAGPAENDQPGPGEEVHFG